MVTAPFDSDLCGGARNCIPQPGTSQGLDTISDRLMMHLWYRNFASHEALLVNQTVDVDGNDHAGVRWYEIRDPGALVNATAVAVTNWVFSHWSGDIDNLGSAQLPLNTVTMDKSKSITATFVLDGDTIFLPIVMKR